MTKRFLAFFLSVLTLISLPLGAYAEPLKGFDPGIENVSSYQEAVFLSGRPVIMSGTVRTTVRDRDDQRTETYRFELSDPATGDTLSRNLSLRTSIEDTGDQLIERTEVATFKESITIEGTTYEADLDTSEFTQSIVTQIKPAVDYFSGNMSFRKRYTSDDEDNITIQMEGTTVGYEQAWGATETRTMDYHVSSNRSNGPSGTYSVMSSHNITRDLEYIPNQPTQISFRGGYMISEKEESKIQYNYDMNGRRGNNSFTLGNNPTFERLYVSNLRDMGGHWAQESVSLLASLGAIEPKAMYFGPSLPMSRAEFAKAVAVASDIAEEMQTSTRRRTVEPALFFDTEVEDENYRYIKTVATKGIMSGVGENRFEPDGHLTKAQAATIMINALGFSGLAPTGAYMTGFRDDYAIPFWARDSVYLAREIGLASGTANNYFQPDKTLTRAEAAALLHNYIMYLTYEMREDYRERILNYY
ncbi:hypothetical protein J2Z35_000918 [Acetoanaerobium pronyense]|uniref:SLH domain-containing protein n=1 Tax=Acetoanaerobium pronyense TaxID=1482736 RepID=A0ABS4KKG5_9FIRM|nr:S-layer homology domain-containing protein [Acetoanaerobium pronyense]MBP2027124.1 hypothetical protein [Acetoanaerobium pronyense]